MIDDILVERFRGLRRLAVAGFGRVNVIIGKNNCGKTALMEALGMAAAPSIRSLMFLQERRRVKATVGDFARYWLPLFHEHDADGGFSIRASTTRGERSIAIKRLERTSSVIGEDPSAVPTWALSLSTTRDGASKTKRVSVGSRLALEPAPSPTFNWVSSIKELGSFEIAVLSELKQEGRDHEIVEALRIVDGLITGIELLAPSGNQPEIFVRMGRNGRLLVADSMGDGFQRCLEIAIGSCQSEVIALQLIDEIENGLHHSVLEPIWRWLALISRARNIQIFATSHSEECIAAATRAFTTLGDDGLRVIRLDRHEEHTTAAVYDRKLVETAVDAGVELRG